jgi:hypothetical protein
MSRREDRERPAVRPLVTDGQAQRALEDLMPLIEEATNADTLLQEVKEGWVDESTLEGRLLRRVMTAIRDMDAGSPAIDAYLRWLERNTEEDPST